MADVTTRDTMPGTLSCPFGAGHMGITAEIATCEHDTSRAAQDALDLQSRQRVATAIEAGVLRDRIVPVQVRVKRIMVVFAMDEYPKATTTDALAGLSIVFQKAGMVIAGNDDRIRVRLFDPAIQ